MEHSADWRPDALAVIDDWAENTDRGIVISPDVDGLASACALAAILPGTHIMGIYTAVHLLLLGEETPLSSAADALWLDHDVSQPGIRCLGQHLIHHQASDTLPRRHPVSFNPNAWVRQSWDASFKGKGGKSRDKYPFGTVHMLVDLAGWSTRTEADFIALMAHADGTWFNAVNYAPNFEIWRTAMFPDSPLMRRIGPGYWDDQDAIKAHTYLVGQLVGHGIARTVSRSPRAKSLGPDLEYLTGKQSIAGRPTNKDPSGYVSNYLGALDVIGSILGAQPDTADSPGLLVSGRRETEYPNRIDDFDAMMETSEIFSHAFTDFRTLSYTVDLRIE